jgi:hypothetical protein
MLSGLWDLQHNLLKDVINFSGSHGVSIHLHSFIHITQNGPINLPAPIMVQGQEGNGTQTRNPSKPEAESDLGGKIRLYIKNLRVIYCTLWL